MQILLTVLLVAGGILVYDALRARPEPAALPVIERAPETPTEPPVEIPTPLAVLEGRGDDLWRGAVDRRLAELEARVTGGGGGETTSGPESPEAAEGDPAAEEAPAAEGGDAPAARPIRAAELRRFRAMLEAVEQQRRREQAAAQIYRFLEGIDLSLTDEQRKSVVETTLTYQDRWRQLNRPPPADEREREERRETYRALWGEFSDALRGLVPAVEADRILSEIQRAGQRSARDGSGRR